MKNTKANRIKYLQQQLQLLGKRGDILSVAKELNNALSKKRQVIIIKRWSELRSELGSELRSELGSELRSELGSSTFEYYENVWPIFINEFYPQLKVLQKNKNKIDALRKIVRAGNAYIWLSKKKLYVLPFPETSLDETKRLHSEASYALKFADKKTYWLNGVKLDKSLWTKIVKRKLSFKECSSISNMEQRMIALKYMRIDKLLKGVKAKLLDSKRGYELYEIKDIFNQTEYAVKYKDTSTNRIYLSFVNTRVGKRGRVLDCMAWKFGFKGEKFKFDKES